MDSEQQQLQHIRELVSRLMRSLLILERGEFSCLGVTLTQCYLIQELAAAGSLSMNELSDRLGMATSTGTRVVEVLVRNGIVERYRDPADRRLVLVRLTPSGHELAGRLIDCSHKMWEGVLAAIPPEKRDQVAESVRILMDAITEAWGSCCR